MLDEALEQQSEGPTPPKVNKVNKLQLRIYINIKYHIGNWIALEESNSFKRNRRNFGFGCEILEH